MGHERVVPLASDRPVVGPVRERALEPGRVELDGDLGGVRGPAEAPSLRPVDGSVRGRDDLIEEGRDLGGGLDLDPLPHPDLRLDRAGTRLVEVLGDGLEAPGDRRQPLGEGGMVAGEQEEQPVADRVEGERPALPDAQHVRVEDGSADVVQLQVALEAGGRRQVGWIEGLDLREVAPIGLELGENRLTSAVAELVVERVQAQGGPQDRVVADQPAQSRLDEVVERVVARPAVAGVGRARQVGRECRVGQ